MFPKPGLCSSCPALPGHGHQPALPFHAFCSDRNTRAALPREKGTFARPSGEAAPQGTEEKPRVHHLKGRRKRARQRPSTPGASHRSRGRQRPPSQPFSRPPESLGGAHPSAHPGSSRPGAPHPPLLCHHHCITPAGTADVPPGWETQPPGTIASHSPPPCSSPQPKGALSSPLTGQTRSFFPLREPRSDSALPNTRPQRGGYVSRNCLSAVPCFRPARV